MKQLGQQFAFGTALLKCLKHPITSCVKIYRLRRGGGHSKVGSSTKITQSLIADCAWTNYDCSLLAKEYQSFNCNINIKGLL